MAPSAVFRDASPRRGMYESFYLRAVAPDQPVGIWIRHTVHKRPGERPLGSVWCTVFDGGRGAPFAHKLTSDELSVPPAGWISVGGVEPGPRDGGAGGEGASLTAESADGSCGPASWSLRFAAQAKELRHLPRAWLYRAPVPRTKLTSPAPRASFDGVLEVSGRAAIELRGWPGMVGHNWGSEHAERWIWLHGVGFQQAPEAWLDLALGRVKVAGRTTPWVANGAVSLDGRVHRLGGLTARGLHVEETAAGCVVRVAGERGVAVELHAEVPPGTAAGWHYADPHGGAGHDVVNCSIAALALAVKLPDQAAPRALRTAHGAAYELGMREHDHGVSIAPFPDG